MPPEPSSPDPLQDLDGPSIYNVTPAPRTIRHRTTSTIISPRKNKKLSHTTVVSTPTRSPWRIRVVVEAERDDEEGEEVPASKRARMTNIKTTKVPLRGLSPVVTVSQEDGEVVKKKSTPARRRRSTTATPGGPGKTPAKKVRGRMSETPVLEEEEHVDEGIGPSEDGFEENEGVSLVPMVVVPKRTKATPRKTTTPGKTPRKAASPRKSPAKRTPASRAPRTVASSSKAPPPPEEDEEEVLEESHPQANTRSALSPVSSNRILSPTPSPRKHSPAKARQAAQSPAPRPLLDFGSSNGSNDDEMEGFSMVDTNSLLPDFLNSLSHQNHEPDAITEVEVGNMLESEPEDEEDEDMDLPDFTFVSHGTSYTPHANKKSNIPPTNKQEELFEEDPVGTQSFYGIPEQGKQLFRSSPPPLLQAKAKNATETSKITPVLKPAEELPLPEQAQATKTRKRRRSTPALDHAKLASEGLRSSMGVEESPRRMNMSMRSERFGSVLDQEEQELYAELDKQNKRTEEDERVAGEEGYAELEEMSDGDTDGSFEYPDLPEPTEEPVAYLPPKPELSASTSNKVDLKGKGKALAPQPAPIAPPLEEEEEDYMLWAPSSPSSPPKSPNKSVRFLGHENSRNSPSIVPNDSVGPGHHTRMLEESWARERAEVSRKAREVGTLTIDDDELEEDTMEAEKIIADMWEVEAEPRSEDTPAKPKGVRRGLAPESSPPAKLLLAQSSPMGERTMERERLWREEREEVVRKAKEVGWVSVHDTIEEQEEEEEQPKLKLQPQRRTQPQPQPQSQHQEEEDHYGAHPSNSTTLLNQDTAAFEESLFHREQQQIRPPSGALFTSSSTPYKRGSSVSSRQTESSRSSPPPEMGGKGTGRWGGAKNIDGSTTLDENTKTTMKTATPAKVMAEIPVKATLGKKDTATDTATDTWKATTSQRIARTAARIAALEKGKATTMKKDSAVENSIPTAKTTPGESVPAAEAKGEKENSTRPTCRLREPRKRLVEMEEAAEEAVEEESLNMLTEDLLTPPLPEEIHTPSDVLTPPASFTATPEVAPVAAPVPVPVVAARPTRSRPPKARISRAPVEAPVAAPAPRRTRTARSTIPASRAVPIPPPRVGPVWEKRHWKLLERFLQSSKTIPPPDSRLTYQISIDDPAALGPDYESILTDPELNITTMEGGEKALVLRGKEVEAVKRFMERMAKEGGEVERGWGVEMVAGKVGALKVASVRRRRREEINKNEQKEKTKKMERAMGNERRGRGEKELLSPVGKGHGAGERKKGERLSDWL